MNYYLFRFANESLHSHVIIDALIRMHSAKENDSDEMSKVMRGFRDEPMRLYPFDDFLAWVLAFEAIRAVCT